MNIAGRSAHGRDGPVQNDHERRHLWAGDTDALPTRPHREPDGLSRASRRYLPAALHCAAEDDDVVALQALVELSMTAERNAEVAAALERLAASEGGNI